MVEAENLTLEDEVEELKTKLAKVEEQVREIVEPVKKTLFDIRTLMSELENPFNLLRVLGENLDKYRSSQPESLSEAVQPKEAAEKEPAKEIPTDRSQPKNCLGTEPSKPQPREIKSLISEWLKTREDKQAEASLEAGGYGKFMAVLACTSYLVFTFGKVKLEELLEAYERDGWIPEGISKTIKSVAKTVFGEDEEFSPFKFPLNGEPAIEDYLLAAILLNMLARGGDDLVFLVILLVVSKLMDRFPYAKDFNLNLQALNVRRDR